ncbi:Tripartite tricarboxylate transporter family receptor [Pigmentiphaga humi]|uniref:Tripartite tricarboxylate transporter family receptor n=1 Tax=Pigmentiphaga humi TaxID=2478468 RepID=A0A3P4AYH4_9BURK|nr:tripartite tricarboxylate transporter substrate binding protein [Pigmentiphaga humi]VCU68832.1 Tripartite tricarboxylate transporter family receptor [Pigmentiphaga humi]
MHARVAAAIGASLALLANQPAGAADAWPAKPVRIIVPQAPGGQSDIFVRLFGNELSQRLGVPVVVENRAGGNTFIAVRGCTSAKDDHTFCVFYTDTTMVANPLLLKDIPYDPDKDLMPITPLFVSTQVVAVNAKLGVNSMQELVQASRRQSGGLSYATPSHSLAIMYMEKFKREAGADLTYIPYKGGGEVVQAVVGGTTPVGFVSYVNVIPHVKSGQLKVLAVDSEQRFASLPDVPTLKEAGYHYDRPRTVLGLFAPEGTPAAVVERMYRDSRAILDDAAFNRQHMVPAGLEVKDMAPSAFASHIRNDRSYAQVLVKEAGVQPQ